MALTVARAGKSTYIAEVTPPHSSKAWKSPRPMELRGLIAELERVGCHQQDIGDALYEIDPEWMAHLD